MTDAHKVPPVDTGKVKIGIYHQRDTRPKLSAFEERLQQALLGKPGNAVERWLDAHPRLAPAAIFAALVLAMAAVGSIQNT